jgi:hypothetical protein
MPNTENAARFVGNSLVGPPESLSKKFRFVNQKMI